jgi:hypothetical protein
MARLLGRQSGSDPSQHHVSEGQEDGALPFGRQPLPRSRSRLTGLAHRAIQANAPEHAVLRCRFSAIRPIPSNYQRHPVWDIELFFRWVKQTLKIKHFVGRSENAVRIQLAVALIAFLLLRMAQATHRIVESPLAFARLIRANLMHDRPIHRLHEPEDPPPPNQTENATRCGPKQLCSKPQYS